MVAIIISAVFVVMLSYLTEIMHLSKQKQIQHPKRVKGILNTTSEILYTFGAVFSQANSNLPTKTPSRIFTACYWLFLITMVAAFIAHLVATMAVQRFKLGVKTFDDLANHPTFEVGMPFGSAMTDFFRYSKSGMPRKLWERKINPHPENLLPYTDDGFLTQLERVRSHNYALIGEVVDFEMRISMLKPCDVVMGEEKIFLGYFGYAAYKGFPYMDMISNR